MMARAQNTFLHLGIYIVDLAHAHSSGAQAHPFVLHVLSFFMYYFGHREREHSLFVIKSSRGKYAADSKTHQKRILLMPRSCTDSYVALFSKRSEPLIFFERY